ncbi:MAG TPA: 50S ribosomal protein L21 [Actinomycetota bacterium]|nr:50S ribosomal protein L21 [Actinomycetota bacterium]
MYAVIRTGGKQYRVKPGDILEIEHLSTKDAEVTFRPLLVSTDDGQTVHGTAAGDYPVVAKLVGDAKGDKIIVFKYRNKTGYAAKNGHRQLLSVIRIASIGSEVAKEPAPAEPAAAALDEDAIDEVAVDEVAEES